MMPRTILFLLTTTTVLSGCNQLIYESIQSNQAQECNRKINDTQRAECIEGLSTPDYNDYKHQRDELLKNKNI